LEKKMVVMLTFLKIKPESPQQPQALADIWGAILRGRKGYKSSVFFGDDATREYGSIVIWESKEDAEYAEELFSEFKEPLRGNSRDTIRHKLYKIIEPKGTAEDK
jgi:hypothetical protein